MLVFGTRHLGRGVTESARELFAQLETSPEKADFDVGLAEMEEFRRLSDGQAFDIAEEEDEPVLLVQLRQRFLNQPACLVALHQALGRLAPIRDELGMSHPLPIVLWFDGFVEGCGGSPRRLRMTFSAA